MVEHQITPENIKDKLRMTKFRHCTMVKANSDQYQPNQKVIKINTKTIFNNKKCKR